MFKTRASLRFPSAHAPFIRTTRVGSANALRMFSPQSLTKPIS